VRPRPSTWAGAAATISHYIRTSHPHPHPHPTGTAGGAATVGRAASGIVYCLSRDDCEALAAYLAADGIAADHYHAGMPPQQRVLVQNAWQRGDTAVVVATVAFGMVRAGGEPCAAFDCHIDTPRCVWWGLATRAGYRQAGRAVRGARVPAHQR
jgi:hypothetical protein